MNSCIFVVLVLLLEAYCRPHGQDVLAGEEFLAVFMRSHRPRAEHYVRPATVSTTEVTTSVVTEAASTTLETEPPQVVSVRVSSSVRKEAPVHEPVVQPISEAVNELVPESAPEPVHEHVHEPVHDAVGAEAQRSHFSVESSGYRVEDSLAEATQDHESLKAEDKPYAEALTLEESGIHYESRVSSETSQSRIYFSQPKHSAIIQPSLIRRDETKFEPQVASQPFIQNREDRKYRPEIVVTQTHQESKSDPRLLFSQEEPDTKISAQALLAEQLRKFEPEVIVTREETKYGPEIVVTQTQSERKYIPGVYATQSQERSQPISNQPPSTSTDNPQNVASQDPENRKYISQNREQRQYPTQDQRTESQPQEGTIGTRNSHDESSNQGEYKGEPKEERNYEQEEQNYEVDEAISVMTNGRAHGVQTESPPNHKFGYVQDGNNFRKYRVEEKTPDGFIVGEYGVVNHDGGGIRGVRYTADGSISPRLIYEALVKFLSLK